MPRRYIQYHTWQFIKYSDELAPRLGSPSVSWDILAPVYPNTFWIAKYLGITKQETLSEPAWYDFMLYWIISHNTVPSSTSPGTNVLEVVALLRRRNCCLPVCLPVWIDR